jgi:signal transduction histidine kinase
MSAAQRIWDGLRHPTVRLRLTAIYAAIFAVCGVALIAITLGLTATGDLLFPGLGLSLTSGQVVVATEGSLPMMLPGSGAVTGTTQLKVAQAAADSIRRKALDDLFRSGGIALAVTLSLAVLLSWLAAGRALAPLRSITGTARRLTHENLRERIALEGPRDELHDLADTLDAMLDRLSSAFDAQRRFVSNASHELRTPLTRERALVDVTLADPHASVVSLRAMGERVRVAVDEQERLIDGLLTLARGDRGIERFETVDLAEVTARAIDAADHAEHPAEIRMTKELGRATVRGDPELLERMAFNLVDNALTHNVRGGWADVRTSAFGDTAKLQVGNGGPVMPPEVIPVLFEPFRRHGTDRTGARRRNGLGLSIVSAIAKAHAGVVRAEPGVAGGLEIVVTLPRVNAEAARTSDS